MPTDPYQHAREEIAKALLQACHVSAVRFDARTPSLMSLENRAAWADISIPRYSQAFLGAALLANKRGAESFRDYFTAISTTEWTTAFTSVYGLSPVDFYREYDVWFRAQRAAGSRCPMSG